MNLRTTWNRNIETPFRSEIESSLSKFSWLIPGWLHRLHVNLVLSDGDGVMASIRVHYEYREACLDVMPDWLNQPGPERDRQILHELLHLHLALIADFARDTFNTLSSPNDGSKINTFINNELRTRHESATQDLAEAIFQRFPD
ncbi:MAG: hypothetical protein AB7P97_21580 [Hyphomonadaceae bacterium]